MIQDIPQGHDDTLLPNNIPPSPAQKKYKMSKEVEGKIYQALLLAEERLADAVHGGKNQWGEDKLKRTLCDMDKLCKKYPWLRELGKGYMIATFK